MIALVSYFEGSMSSLADHLRKEESKPIDTRTFVDELSPDVSPQFSIGQEVKVNKRVSDLGKALIVGCEWGCRNQGAHIKAKNKSGNGWLYLLTEQKEWHPGVIIKRWYASEEEIQQWQK